jgi:hypothetical protein
MDRFSRLQALTGDKEAYDGVNGEYEEEYKFEPFMFSTTRPRHLYEGTDSEDDEIITSRRSEKNVAYVNPDSYQVGMLNMLRVIVYTISRIYIVHVVNMASQYVESLFIKSCSFLKPLRSHSISPNEDHVP